MPRAVIGNPVPAWLRPENASVLDSLGTKGMRAIASILGINDPQSQVLGMMMPLELPVAPKSLRRLLLPKDPAYAYHATNLERLEGIQEAGLKTHKPWEFTDQSTWPDGSTEKRAYFGEDPTHVGAFAPADGTPVILRTPRSTALLRERGTGDLYTKRPVVPDLLEYLGVTDAWHPLKKAIAHR